MCFKGSVPAAYIRELEAAASVSERFRVDVDEHINASDVRIGPASWVGEMQRVAPTSAGRGAGAGAASAVIDADDLSSIFVNGVEFSLVILATGTSLDIAGSPLHTKVAARFPTKFEGNLPVTTPPPTTSFFLHSRTLMGSRGFYDGIRGTPAASS